MMNETDGQTDSYFLKKVVVCHECSKPITAMYLFTVKSNKINKIIMAELVNPVSY